jgi:hypothetical protein
LHADKLFMGRLAWMIIGFLLVEGSTRWNGLASMRVAVIGSTFEIMLFTCGGAKGTRTPGLLHAMNN